MKAPLVIPSILLSLSLVVASPAHAITAPATIELAPCDASVAASCAVSSVIAAKTAEADLHALPPGAQKPHKADDPVTPVPEPQTFVMLMLGLVVLGFASRRREPAEKFDD